MDGIYEKNYEIKYYDIDCTNKATVLSLIEYMQETSSMHSESVDCGMEYLGSKGEAWVLLDVHSKIFRLPKFGDKIISRTWAIGGDKVFAYRQYEIVNEKYEQICISTSKWIIYSREKLMPLRMYDDVKNKYIHIDKKVMENEYIKIPEDIESEKNVIGEIEYRDIDTNWHMNNTKYLKLAIESMDIDFLNENTVEEYSVSYRHQLKYGNKYIIWISKISEKEYIYNIKEYSESEENKKSNCGIYIKWKHKQEA